MRRLLLHFTCDVASIRQVDLSKVVFTSCALAGDIAKVFLESFAFNSILAISIPSTWKTKSHCVSYGFILPNNHNRLWFDLEWLKVQKIYSYIVWRNCEASRILETRNWFYEPIIFINLMSAPRDMKSHFDDITWQRIKTYFALKSKIESFSCEFNFSTFILDNDIMTDKITNKHIAISNVFHNMFIIQIMTSSSSPLIITFRPQEAPGLSQRDNI